VTSSWFWPPMAARLIARFLPLPRLGTAPSGRSSHRVSALGNSVYVIGGEEEARVPIDSTVHILDLSSQFSPWRSIPHAMSSPPARIAHAQGILTGHTNQLMLFGGRAGVKMDEEPLNDMWSFDITTEKWTRVQPKGDIPSPRSFQSATTFGDKFYVFGGCGEEGRLADLYEYCAAANAWRRLGDAPVAGRGGAVLEASTDGKSLWLVGGFAGHETRDVLRYDVASNRWSVLPSEWLRPRSVSASFALANNIFVFGGEVQPSDAGHEGAGAFADDLIAMDASTGVEVPVRMDSAAPAGATLLPPARGWGGAAALSGNRAIMFGGLAGDDAAPERLADAWLVSLESASSL